MDVDSSMATETDHDQNHNNGPTQSPAPAEKVYFGVSVSMVLLFTLAMAAATALGVVLFFFVELDPQWAGICNGMAAGVMLAASFDLTQEGQEHGAGSWGVIGIIAVGVFILLWKKEGSFLGRFVEAIHYYSSVFDSFGESYGEESEERHVVEQQLLSKEIQNVLGIGGSMKFHNWREKLQQCEFKGISLAGMSMSVMYLRKHYLCFK